MLWGCALPAAGEGPTAALLSRERSPVRSAMLYEPGPKGPAFSATSSASFRFWSNSSHLERSEKQKGRLHLRNTLTGRICTSRGSAAFAGTFHESRDSNRGSNFVC